MNLGLNLSCVTKRWPLPEAWASFVRNRLDLDLVQFNFDLLDPMWPDPERTRIARRVRRAAEANGLEIHSAFIGLSAYAHSGLLHPDPDARQVQIEWWKRGIDVAAQIGAHSMGGPVGSVGAEDSSGARFDELVETLVELAREAEERGLDSLLVEPTPIGREIPNSVEEAERLCRALDGQTAIPVRQLLDVGHAGYRPFYGPTASIVPWLTLGTWIGAFHLQNADFQSDSHWGWPHDRGLVDVALISQQVADAGLADRPAFIEIFYPFELDDREVEENIVSSVAHCRRAIRLREPLTTERSRI
jgi:sugar phosphate isomerase/epimerase